MDSLVLQARGKDDNPDVHPATNRIHLQDVIYCAVQPKPPRCKVQPLYL